ncbi:dihydrofolate reductase family protein [Streptococcus sp. S784/96/1]|uniref:dihydrofolate reductase family protein n=1 Tax=Streptococcus sp. S784/96/1 TaxID=2653499 RepID=UPI001EE4C8C6|nr:dihydrofolate reductase family protein [Streptococcus sp. S784/96/1]
MVITSDPKQLDFSVKEDNLHIILQEQISLKEALEILNKDYGCDRLTVQSAGTVDGLFLRGKLFDFVDIVVAPILIGGKDTSALIDGQSLKSKKTIQFGCVKDDRMYCFGGFLYKIAILGDWLIIRVLQGERYVRTGSDKTEYFTL